MPISWAGSYVVQCVWSPPRYQRMSVIFDCGSSCNFHLFIWAASSEFVSSSIPSWQILTAHAQPFRGARDLVFCLKVPLDSLLVWASSEGSGETARMRRLAWTFAARIGDKYQIRLMQSIYLFYFTLFYCILFIHCFERVTLLALLTFLPSGPLN